jgi:hypothetical protein
MCGDNLITFGLVSIWEKIFGRIMGAIILVSFASMIAMFLWALYLTITERFYG